MHTISVVIPAYREEANIEPVYERLAGVFEPLAVDWELIFSRRPQPRPDRGADPRAAQARSAG